MRKIRCFSIFTILVVMISWSPGQKKYFTRRVSNELRKGPANYYPLIGIVPQNTVLTGFRIDDGWTQVHIDGELAKLLETSLTKGWISKNCLMDRPVEEKNRQLKISTKVATPSSVAAAIRGFAIRFKLTSAKNIDALLEKDHPFITPGEYKSFVQESNIHQTVEIDQTLRNKYDALLNEYDATFQESMIGFNIAAQIASRGIVQNPRLHTYLNLLTTFILQQSNAYDRNFRIYVLESSKPEAYSTSGDIIFISSGLIRACTSEAELAGLIAHEIAHVMLQHGMKETRQRAHKIKAEEAFAELDEAAKNSADSTETGLEEYLQEAYDSVVKPRLLTYEEEADRGALVLMAEAGYDPNALVPLINRIPTLVPKQENDLEDNPFMKRDYEQRSHAAAVCIHEYFPHAKGAINTARFEKYCAKMEKE